MVLTALSENSKLLIKNVNINQSRIGVVTILKKMGVKINFEKKRIYKGEKIANIRILGPKSLKAINCPRNLNSGAIDEFLVIFLVAAKAKECHILKILANLIRKKVPDLYGETTS